jgi:hypothetical protein
MALSLEQVPEGQPPVPPESIPKKLRTTQPVSITKTIDSYRELKMVCSGIVRAAA